MADVAITPRQAISGKLKIVNISKETFLSRKFRKNSMSRGEGPVGVQYLGVLMLCLALVGCKSPVSASRVGTPMHDSQISLVSEVRREDYNILPTHWFPSVGRWLGSFFLGKGYYSPDQWTRRSYISVSGDLPMMRIGEVWHLTDEIEPIFGTLVYRHPGLAWSVSTTESEITTKELLKARAALRDIQDLTLRTVSQLRSMEEKGDSDSPKSVEDLSKEIRTASDKLNEILNKPGVRVVRWVRDSRGKNSLEINASFDMKSQGGKTMTGYLLLGGIRELRLQPTENIGNRAESSYKLWMRNNPKLVNVNRDNCSTQQDLDVGVVTSLMQSQKIVYWQNSESFESAVLKLDQDLAKLYRKDPTKSADLRLILDVARSVISNLETWGSSGPSSYTVVNPDDEVGYSETKEIGGWRTVQATLIHPYGLSSRPIETSGF